MSNSADTPELESFERWLRTVCFQRPTPEAYDLAKCAWRAAIALQPVPAVPPAWLEFAGEVADDTLLGDSLRAWAKRLLAASQPSTTKGNAND